MKNLQITITGNIYHVGFRYFIKQTAFRYGVMGFVKYQNKTSLIIEAEGEPKALNRLIELCRIGSYGSIIKKIDVSETPLKDYQTFEVID